MEDRCKFWLPKKNRFCANAPLYNSFFCGNHNPRSDGQWVRCSIDPSHSVLQENLEAHLRKCPLQRQVQSLTLQPFYQKGINAGTEEEEEERTLPVEEEGVMANPRSDAVLDKPNLGSLDSVTSGMKRNAVYRMTVPEFYKLINKIKAVHNSICEDIRESYSVPEACDIWIKKEVDRKLPFQEKHVVQQASILGNLEEFGVLKNTVGREQKEDEESSANDNNDENHVVAVVEFGAGRGYLTQMLADCYGIERVFLVERKSYKLKADRSLRQKERLILERLRIDSNVSLYPDFENEFYVEDLNLNAVDSLKGLPYVAIGKHLCGPATDLTLRCCLAQQYSQGHGGVSNYLRGLAIATCCHHLCQWKHYINKKYLLSLGIAKEEFHSITWFTSWAVDADHGSDLSGVSDCRVHLPSAENIAEASSVENVVSDMKAVERAVLGFMCKQIIDMGRLMWVKECGLETRLVKYVPPTISPENHLLFARHANQ